MKQFRSRCTALLLVIIIFLSSCGANRNLVYFSDLPNKPGSISPVHEITPRIQPGDILSVIVTTSSAQTNMLFSTTSTTIMRNGNQELAGYRVDSNGNINLPVIGLTKMNGLTIEEAQKQIGNKMAEYANDPIVNVQFLNFRVTVIGEVNRPSTFTVSSDQINLLEAIGMAGDLTSYGKRENILVLREQGNGSRALQRINLNKQEVLNSPYFYLKQNDIVYVEPDKSKAIAVNPNYRFMPVLLTIISAGTIIWTARMNNR